MKKVDQSALLTALHCSWAGISKSIIKCKNEVTEWPNQDTEKIASQWS